MLKKTIKLFILVTLPLVLLCARFDDSTNLGKDIIKSINPTLVELDQNFDSFERDTSIVSNQFSIPDDDDTLFGVHSGQLAAGSKTGYSVTGYTEFNIGVSAGNRFESDDSLISISILFDTDTLGAVSPQNTVLLLFSSSKENIFSRTVQSAGSLVDTLTSTDSLNTRFSAEITDSLKDSIFEACLALKKCLAACPDDSTACQNNCFALPVQVFSFSLFNTDPSSFTRLKPSPVMKITFGRAGTILVDTLIRANFSNYVVKEDSLISWQLEPRTSNASGRTAIHQIDISSLWEHMDSAGFGEILSAGFTIQPASYQNLEISDSIFSVRHYLSDNLIENGFTLDEKLGSVINAVATFDTSGQFKDTLTLPVDRFLQNLTTTRPSTVYLYMQLSTRNNVTWEEVFWEKPRFKAVITTLR